MSAKADTSRITITGPGLTTPIENTAPNVLAKFRVWAGPMTSSNEAESLIVNWAQGAVADRPKGLSRYQVSFYVKNKQKNEEYLVYVVFYEFDPANAQGYVYVPGRTDEQYERNTFSIYHGVEGNTFRAWQAWEDVAKPLIAKAKDRSRE